MIETENAMSKKRCVILSNKGFLFVMGAVIVSVTVVSSLFFSVFTFSAVQGRSMEPTFSEGEHLLALNLDNDYAPRRGDIVGFVTEHLSLSGEEGELLKRVVGLPGDVVEIVDHQVFINGVLLDEPYAQWNYQPVPSRTDGFPQEFNFQRNCQ